MGDTTLATDNKSNRIVFMDITASNEMEVTSNMRASLYSIIAEPFPKTEDILSFFKQYFGMEYGADADVWERYTIEQHTKMVMGQYDKYFSKDTLPLGVSHGFFKTVLALHDIGKPEAIKSGGKHLQHRYTSKIMKQTLSDLGFDKREVDIAVALVSDDCIGNCLKGGDPELSAQTIRSLAKERNLSPEELFELMLILYKVDAGSYTVDAGGLYSLDTLFVFDRENGKMDLSTRPLERVNQLRQLVSRF